jgi:hypothetical protein
MRHWEVERSYVFKVVVPSSLSREDNCLQHADASDRHEVSNVI